MLARSNFAHFNSLFYIYTTEYSTWKCNHEWVFMWAAMLIDQPTTADSGQCQVILIIPIHGIFKSSNRKVNIADRDKSREFFHWFLWIRFNRNGLRWTEHYYQICWWNNSQNRFVQAKVFEENQVWTFAGAVWFFVKLPNAELLIYLTLTSVNTHNHFDDHVCVSMWCRCFDPFKG